MKGFNRISSSFVSYWNHISGIGSVQQKTRKTISQIRSREYKHIEWITFIRDKLEDPSKEGKELAYEIADDIEAKIQEFRDLGYERNTHGRHFIGGMERVRDNFRKKGDQLQSMIEECMDGEGSWHSSPLEDEGHILSEDIDAICMFGLSIEHYVLPRAQISEDPNVSGVSYVSLSSNVIRGRSESLLAINTSIHENVHNYYSTCIDQSAYPIRDFKKIIAYFCSKIEKHEKPSIDEEKFITQVLDRFQGELVANFHEIHVSFATEKADFDDMMIWMDTYQKSLSSPDAKKFLSSFSQKFNSRVLDTFYLTRNIAKVARMHDIFEEVKSACMRYKPSQYHRVVSYIERRTGSNFDSDIDTLNRIQKSLSSSVSLLYKHGTSPHSPSLFTPQGHNHRK